MWAGRLNASGNATPITYLGKDGQQYVVIAAGGPAHLRNVGDTSANSADTLIAFSLAGSEPEAAPLVTHLTPSTTSPAADAGLPEAEGKPVVERMCAQCHGVDTFAQSRMSPEEWKAVVADMIARGASGTPDEIRTVESYLAKNLPGPAGTRRRR